MPSVFLTIYFEPNALSSVGIEGRDEVEESLDEALSVSEIGEVSGGGSGDLGASIDIDIENENKLDEAISVIRQILIGLNVPSSTIIKRAKPIETTYSVY